MAGLALAFIAGSAWGADDQTLRDLLAPPPVVLQPLASGEKAQPVKLAKVVIQPRDGEAWAIVYEMSPTGPWAPRRSPNERIPWKGGRIESYSGLLDENGQMVGVTDRVYAPDGFPIDDALRILALSPAR
ncbi:MAG: hypothetical protein JWQ46_2094 [Phenylobacterium sp.]|nr:hypothetical protein [Phenylobacterium sp.]